MRVGETRYMIVGLRKNGGVSSIEVVGSVDNIDSKPDSEFRVICRLYENEYRWFYIVNESNGVVKYSNSRNSLNYIFSN
jgi:hypothetical protein